MPNSIRRLFESARGAACGWVCCVSACAVMRVSSLDRGSFSSQRGVNADAGAVIMTEMRSFSPGPKLLADGAAVLEHRELCFAA